MEYVDEQYFLQVHEEIGSISENDIAVSCPMCREGRSWGRKHRLHLYMKPGYDSPAVKCFNCEYSSNLYGYLKEFHPAEFSSYRKAKSGKGFAELRMNAEKDDLENNKPDLGNINTGLIFEEPKEIKAPIKAPETVAVTPEINLEGFADGETPVDMSALGGMDFGLDFSGEVAPITKIAEVPKKEEPIKLTEDGPFLVKPVQNLIELPQEAIAYIEKRGLEVQESWLYSPKDNKIKFNDVDIYLSEYILIPFTIDGLWYGFQALAWKEKRFFIYMVTGNSGFKVENWDGINKEEPVYIFESIYDRLSSGLENSVAALGANLGEDRLKELKEPVLCLDNQNCDEKSKEQSMKYLKEGHKVLLWPEGSDKFKDTNDLRKVGVPYETIKKMILNNIQKGMKGILKLKFYE